MPPFNRALQLMQQNVCVLCVDQRAHAPFERECSNSRPSAGVVDAIAEFDREFGARQSSSNFQLSAITQAYSSCCIC
jgi:hypothetical protein